MYGVAIAETSGSVDTEAEALAGELRATVYDLRQRLVGVLPVVVATTPDGARASSLRDLLSSRGHGALVVDLDEVVASAAMVSMRRLVLEETEVRLSDQSYEHLAYREISTLVHARRALEVVTHGSAPLADHFSARGNKPSHSFRRVLHLEQDSFEVLYVFGQAGHKPWILRAYDVAGTRPGERPLTQRQLFLSFVEELVRRSPGAVFDERLLKAKLDPGHFAVAGIGLGARKRAVGAADLTAHLIAAWTGHKRTRGPYRG